MAKKYVLERYLDALIKGDRNSCRTVIEETLQTGVPVNCVYMDVIWPIMVEIERLYRDNKINAAQEALASRINRTIIDQLQNKLPCKPKREQKVVVCSNPSEQSELGAQIIVDLFESDGWDSRFLGGSVNNDDIMNFIHEFKPDMLIIYGTEAKGAPDVRHLIDKLKGINAYPDMKIMLSGGVFGRAEGLWEEIGADLYAETAGEAVKLATAGEDDTPIPERTIKRRRRRKADTELEATEAKAMV